MAVSLPGRSIGLYLHAMNLSTATVAVPARKTSADTLKSLLTLQLTAFVIAALYFGRELFIPLALAALLAFLLAPLVTRLQRWLGRVLSVATVVLSVFVVLGIAGWVLTDQSLQLAAKLPDYRENLLNKAKYLRMPGGTQFSKLSNLFRDLRNEMPGGKSAPQPSEADKFHGPTETTRGTPGEPLSVEVVRAGEPIPMFLGSVITPLLGPLGTAGLVMLLVVCILLQREDLKSRFIRLAGGGRISATMNAMEEAQNRVSRYLASQIMVNICYGTSIAIGLFFIGVPNAALWGALSTLLRFVPYVGPWIAMTPPAVLSLAISPTWSTPLFTIALFIGLELLCGNVLEPLLYSSRTGVSAIALIMGAVFWTGLWGFVGLILAAPITVCLVVLGRHVPRLSFLSILLSDQEPLTPADECYHRLLAPGLADTSDLVDSHLRSNSLASLFDSVLIPVMTTAEVDHQERTIDDEQLDEVLAGLQDIIEDLAERPAVESKVAADVAIAEVQKPSPPPAGSRVLCLPTRGKQDALAGAMLSELLRQQGFEAESLSSTLLVNELAEKVASEEVEILCLSVLPPSTVLHARYICGKLRKKCPQIKLVVGLWGASENTGGASLRLREAGADEVVVSLAEALVQLRKFAAP